MQHELWSSVFLCRQNIPESDVIFGQRSCLQLDSRNDYWCWRFQLNIRHADNNSSLSSRVDKGFYQWMHPNSIKQCPCEIFWNHGDSPAFAGASANNLSTVTSLLFNLCVQNYYPGTQFVLICMHATAHKAIQKMGRNIMSGIQWFSIIKSCLELWKQHVLIPKDLVHSYVHFANHRALSKAGAAKSVKLPNIPLN